jgi:hypothetical protein
MASRSKKDAPNENPEGPNVVNAFPTKELFISMLVKDITLIPAIKDLVDNSVDGARRLRPGRDYKHLWVRVEFAAAEFKIADNCGGIGNEVARKYAFRFGRPEEAGQQKHSIGQFGVGMKRALFKMGGKFAVHSVAERSCFDLTVDVGKWKDDRKNWQFLFDSYKDDVRQAASKRGTTIVVTELHAGVAEEFETDAFETELVEQLQDAHREALDCGLAITVNGVPLQTQPLTLLDSREIKPAFVKKTISAKGKTDVKVKLYAGMSRSKADQDAAGWYIFCNGRLIVAADQSSLTGWGEGSTKRIPKFHPQFSMFRGYVFFDSDDAQLLPWNTMKTGIDTDSPLYRAIKLAMIDLMRPVLDFSYKWDSEKDRFEGDTGPLRSAVKSAHEIRLREVRANETFVSPKPPAATKSDPKVTKISYSVPEKQLAVVKRKLHVRTAKEAGERTFDYYYEMECGEDG